jgi:hypothetical protein
LALLTGRDGVIDNRDALQNFAGSFGMTEILLSYRPSCAARRI